MNNLRILVVDNEDRRADRLIARLYAENQSAVAVPTLDEALEALSIQRFDAVLFPGSEPSQDLTDFAANLRRQESEYIQATRTVLLSCWATRNESPSLDGHLAPGFNPAELAAAVGKYSSGARGSDRAPGTDAPDLAVFLPNQFEDQCVGDSELMVEVIDLFSAERESQLVDMAEALGENDFERLSRIAHTVKGSLASLHAPLARWRTQELEITAKAGNGALAAQVLEQLEQDLATLSCSLATFRQARQRS